MEKDILYFEECMSVLERLPDASIDLFLQDPPFEVSDQSWDRGFVSRLPEYWGLWKQKAKPNAAHVIKATYPFALKLLNSNPDMLRYEWIWIKSAATNQVNAKRMPMRCAEYLFVFYNGQCTYNPQGRERSEHRKVREYKQRESKHDGFLHIKQKARICVLDELCSPVNVLYIPHEADRYYTGNGPMYRHPNRTNPVLWEYLIRTYTNEGEVVFDGFSGSGSIPEACINSNRHYIACETSERYYQMAQQNIAKSKERQLYLTEAKQLGYSPSEMRAKLTLFC